MSMPKSYYKKYYQKNKTRLLSLHYQWRKEHPDKEKEYSRTRFQKIKKDPVLLKKLRNYYLNNKEKYCRNSKKRLQTPHGKFLAYRKNAKTRRISFLLSEEEFLKYWQTPCFYCGEKIKTIGIDRINSKQGYSTKNIHACCRWCNLMKQDKPKKDFLNHCLKIINNLDKIK